MSSRQPTIARSAATILFAVVSIAPLLIAPLGAQFLSKPTRPQVKPPDGLVRQVIFKNCTSCHGIDDYAYNSLDRAGWNTLLEAKHKDQDRDLKALVADNDRQVLLDWLSVRFGPNVKPFPRTYVPPEITTYFSDAEAEALITRACTSCHSVDRVNQARNSAEGWRVVTVDMRERGAKLSDEELERLVEWLGRVKGTNASH
jgi:cytochrome c2